MTATISVKVVKFSILQEIEGDWKPGDYSSLLDAVEFGDTSGLSDAELREMCLMSLQDLDPADAAFLVLKHVIGDALRDGQLRNIANEMQNEKLWEEYADPAYHGRLFTVGSLLYAAMPNVFPKTDAVLIKLDVSALEPKVKDLLYPSPDAAFLVRLLAAGLEESVVLNRLYGNQIKGSHFPNAAEIIWSAQSIETTAGTCEVEVVSSKYWIGGFERVETYDSAAYADAAEKEEV